MDTPGGFLNALVGWLIVGAIVVIFAGLFRGDDHR